MMRKIAALAVLPTMTLLVMPGTASGKDDSPGHTRQCIKRQDNCLGKNEGAGNFTSLPLSFWYGEALPAPEAMMIHEALVGPDGQGPIRALMNKLETENLNPEQRTGLQPGRDTSKAYPGYTLVSSLIAGAILLDMDGNVVKRWQVNAFPARMLPGGSVMGGRGSGRPAYGDASRLVEVDWCSNAPNSPEIWSYGNALPGENPVWGARIHHDWQRGGLPPYPAGEGDQYVPGNATKHWLLIHREPPHELTEHISDLFPLQDDAIVEIDENGNVTWVWNAWEHIHQMGFDAVALEAIRTNKISSFGGTQGNPIPESDWQHLNAVSVLGPNRWYDAGDERFHPDNIIWDGRSSNIIAIIARHDDPQGRWSSGDIVWRTGPDYRFGKENRVGQIIGQHTAHMIPKGLPGEGNILVFDNGGLAGFGSLLPGTPPFWPVAFRSYSRAVEYNPISYEKVWEYVNETDDRAIGGDRRFFSWFISSVQRLPNGNTLITEGHSGRIFEVTRQGEIVWEYFQPFGYVYRAYRYPESYLPPVEARMCPAP
jgi:hypothetical protein